MLNQQKRRYKMKFQRRVHRLHVERTQFAANRTTLAHANACPIIMEIHTMVVDLNVLQTANVQIIWLAWTINAKIHVQVYVVRMLSAAWRITRRNAFARLVSMEIH